MKQYDSYKDSGVEWIGEVPNHWEVVPFKRAITINNGCDYKHVQVEENGYPVIGSGGQFAWANQYMYDGEAVLLGRKGTIDKPMYYNGKFWTVDTMFYGISKKNAKCKYLYYQAKIIPFERYATATALPSMTQTDLNNNRICLPPIDEQSFIATYLDKKCSEIDNVISAQQKRIALLQELKQSVITHVVTKGLDPNVEMKDSGVEWIGEVPSHWDVAPVKRYANIFTGNTPSTKEEKYYDSEDINWFTPVDFYKDCLRESTRRISEISRKENACRVFPSKSVYMIGIGGTIGKIATCEEEASANQQINVIVPNANTDYRYLAYCMRCQKEEIMLSANVVTLPIINQEKTGFLFMPHPRKTVQITIADYLDKKCASIDASISKAQHQVDLLQEYKQSLITEVVTGKRKVC